MDLSHLRLAGRLLRFYQQLGLQALVRGSGVLKLLPKRLRELEAITPDIQPKFSAELIAPVTPAVGRSSIRVAMLIGCAQDLIFSNINLRHRGGARPQRLRSLHARPSSSAAAPCTRITANGTMAQELARKQLEQFPPDQFDAIITNAGGCGSHLKHYRKLLADDPALSRPRGPVGQEGEGHPRVAHRDRRSAACQTMPRRR